MLPEQQQRILGYFIEEARDHLNTIEQGLLNLQSTLNDPEMLNEVFRAAHSIKGGAAMLGLSSIQHTAHRLEDCFKILKEHPIRVDEKLESLFLGVADTLKALLEHLSGPFGLSEEAANTLMSEAEPVFTWLNDHLELLVQKGNSGPDHDEKTVLQTPTIESVNSLTEIFWRRDTSTEQEKTQQPATSPLSTSSPAVTAPDNWSDFQNHVLQALREMLLLFKQQATSESRQNLQQCCRQLEKLGQKWHLPNWSNLCQSAANAIGNYQNTYLTLAKIVITEIKQAQELVLQGREAEIVISQQLEALLSLPELDLFDLTLGLFDDEPAATSETQTHEEVLPVETVQPIDSVTSLTEITQQLKQEPSAIASDNIDNLTKAQTGNSLFGEDDTPLTVNRIHHHGPEVGLAELNTLADLFEGETPELDETWQQEEIIDINSVNELGIDITDIPAEDNDSDLADFLTFDEEISFDDPSATFSTTEDLGLLFDDNFLEKENTELQTATNSAESLQELSEVASQPQQSTAQTSREEAIDDLLNLAHNEVAQPKVEVPVNKVSAAQQSILDELFLETSDTNILEEKPNESVAELQSTSFELNTLDGLFAETEENVLIPTDNLEINDLFDSPVVIETDFAHSDEDLSSFWNSTEEVETQSEFDAVIEEDVAKALEESLFAAAASGEIFGNVQESGSGITEDYGDDFELTFLQPDIEFTSDIQDDLFGELMTPTFGDRNLSLPEMPSFNQPEAVDFTPEFTSSEVLSGDSPQTFGELELNLFDSLDTQSEENQPSSLEELELSVDKTNIQLDITNNASLNLLPNSNSQELSETNIEAIASFNETIIQEDVELGLLDELFTTETSESDADLDKLIAETEIIEFSQLPVLEDDAAPLFAELLNIENSHSSEIKEQTSTDNFDLFLTEFTPSADASLEELMADQVAEEEGLKLEIYENINETIAIDVLRETADSSELLLETSEISLDVPITEVENINVDIPELEAISPTELTKTPETQDNHDEFADLEALLGETQPPSDAGAIAAEDFAALEALLGEDNQPTPAIHNSYIQDVPPAALNHPANSTISSPELEDEFSDLEKLLAEADKTISHASPVKPNTSTVNRSTGRRSARFEETMKVPVKQLDDMSNLVGELVVNRNTLEQDHERLRQSLDNLLIQVQQLSDVGARMQELYERSLLEASLLATRHKKPNHQPTSEHDTDRGFSELEMDRFTPFHTLSQEMIELIVRVRESASDIDFVTEETERVARQFRQVTTQLQEGLTRARMVPFSQAIDRLRRGVRDNAIKCGKQVELVIEGGDTLIDKMILDHLTDPLTHMLNNAIAHGIETPEERQTSGKPPVGEITIRAFHQGNQTVISVGDDGAGIEPERVKAKAVKVGMITKEQARTISRMEVYDLLFQPGFSMKDQADEISGRGVGMDVVRSEISEIRGTVNTDSAIGKGTTFTIRLPLTLSICKALCCVSDKARIAFPMDGVEDTLDIPAKNIQHNADGQSFISWRDTVLPFRPLKDLLSFNRQLSRGNVYGGTRDDDTVSVVVVRSGNTLIALQIDLVLSEQEIVIKQFEGPAPKPIGVAGATVLGDGRIMPIADVLEIIDIFQGRMSKYTGGSTWQQKAPPAVIEAQAEKIDPTVLIVDDSITVRELLSLTFNKAGYRVEQARDGQEAWDKLRSGLPCDIVFCDIEMPRCDGLELLSRIQKDSSLNHLPIAMLTSRGADKHRQMAIQLGASGYFTKPYLEEALLEAAVRMLKGEKLVSSS
ncbi:response regulator [Nostoc sp. FACHB-152]|uniref:hybrid sensor histidine kinase/response regulator n=1 Tax=unclassified Nostoc TaxID=2593658 RepID=UPI0016834F4B|nr:MULTISPECIES: response regulator [unclassified Nostoc]MBD2446077.1 response regulator [Nostoc sp. FACHB-152]MBD2467309.1 response regulator [Nostoc sp. FACHB-145]